MYKWNEELAEYIHIPNYDKDEEEKPGKLRFSCVRSKIAM